MRVNTWLYALTGLANASALIPRNVQDSALNQALSDDEERLQTRAPQFFSLRVDDQCQAGEAAADCPFDGYALRLEQGIVVATPYNRYFDPKLPVFLVDGRTRAFSVSKKELELYVNSITGALRYAPLGFLPPNAIAGGFYKTGNNPLGRLDPSPAYFSWPNPEGRTVPTWFLCPLDATGEYQVFVSNANFGADGPGGVTKAGCTEIGIAAVNASPNGF